MGPRAEHPFATRWNHNTHYFPLLASRLPVSAGRLLDVGCGEGTFCRFVTDRGWMVVGVDSDASVLPAPSTQVRYVRSSAEALPFADEAFTAVTMTMVLHHCNAERALVEGGRVLGPGGVLLALGYGRYGGWTDLPHGRKHGGRCREAPTGGYRCGATWSSGTSRRHERCHKIFRSVENRPCATPEAPRGRVPRRQATPVADGFPVDLEVGKHAVVI